MEFREMIRIQINIVYLSSQIKTNSSKLRIQIFIENQTEISIALKPRLLISVWNDRKAREKTHHQPLDVL